MNGDIRCTFCDCVFIVPKLPEVRLEIARKNDSPDARSVPRRDSCTVGYDDFRLTDGSGMADSVEAQSELHIGGADNHSLRESMFAGLNADSAVSGEVSFREPVPDEAALDSLRREMLRSEKTEELEKGPSSEQDKAAEKDRALLDLFPELQAELPYRYELLPSMSRVGASFSFHSSRPLNADLLEPANRSLRRRESTFDMTISGVTRNSFLLVGIPETDAASFWLKNAAAYQKAAAPRFKGFIDRKRFYDDYERDACWRHVVPEPQGLFLAVFLVPVLLLQRHAPRQKKRSQAVRAGANPRAATWPERWRQD
jgi:hypothetical protein